MGAEPQTDHMDEGKHPITREEASMIIEGIKDLYKRFHEIMEQGADEEKAAAINMMVDLRQKMDTYVREIEEARQIKMSELEAFIKHSKDAYAIQLQGELYEMEKLVKEASYLAEKARETLVPKETGAKKKKKSKIAKNLKTKE